MSASDAITIDAPRFWSTVMRSGEIGPGKAGGLRRLALTDADKEMRDLFITWCTEAGCTVAVDRVGNIFARRPGTEDHLPPVLDGQPPRHPVRGRQVRRHRRGAGRPRGAPHARRPPRAHQASARAGLLDQRGGRALHAADGGLGRLRGGLRRGLGARPARRRRQAVRRRARAHRLQRQGRGGRPLASTPTSSCTSSRGRSSIARRCRSASWSAATPRAGMHVDVHGETAHAGPTPMDRRRNALVGAAMLAVAVNDDRLEVPRHRGQGHGGAPGGLAQQGGHPLRVRPAHLRRAPRRARGGRSDVGGGEGGDARLRATRQRGDGASRASGSSAASASIRAASG